MDKTEAARETQRVAETLQFAEAALARSDAAELHKLFIAARQDHAKLMGVFDTVVQHYAGSKDAPRYQPDAVQAMRDVALAAIDLAARSIGGEKA